MASPGVWTKDRLLVSEALERFPAEVLRPSSGSVIDTGDSVVDPKASSDTCQLRERVHVGAN